MDAGKVAALTVQERRVAALIAEGCPTPEIANRLEIRRTTATHYVSRVLAFMRQRARAEAGEGPELTIREGQVATLVARGATDKEIAAELGIRLRTAEDHVHNILRRLGVRTRGEIPDAMARNAHFSEWQAGFGPDEPRCSVLVRADDTKRV